MNSDTPTERVDNERLHANDGKGYVVPIDFALTLASELETAQNQIEKYKSALNLAGVALREQDSINPALLNPLIQAAINDSR